MVRKIRGNRIQFYRSVRQGGRVVQQYVGSGSTGALIAAVEELEAAQEADRRAERAQQRRRDQADDRASAERSRAVNRVVRLALEAAGYHQHHRSEWRRRRGMNGAIQATKAAPVPAPMTPEVAAIDRRFRGGDNETITNQEARSLLKARPLLENALGSPARQLFCALLSKYVRKDDAVSWTATINRFEQVQADLAGSNPTPMETLLAEHAALCWLELNMIQHAHQWSDDKLTIAQATYRDKRVDGAQRRFLAAVKTLAKVRKLGLPDVLVNVDARSVHYNAPPAPSAPEPTALDVA